MFLIIGKVIMKTLTLALLTVLLTMAAIAQTPTYNLVLKNDALVDSTHYEFEIWLERTGGTVFELATLQPMMTFNTGISAGTLTLSLNGGTSSLGADQVPLVMSVTGNELRINPRVPPGAGTGTVIPVSPGLRVGRFRITSTTAFTAQQANIAWNNTTNPLTKVFAYDASDINIDATDSTNHLSSLSNPSLSPPVITSTSPRPSATAGIVYRDTLRVQGGVPSFTWSIIAGALPAGITMSSTGIVSGTATVAGAFNYTARVVDNVLGADTAAYALTVNPGAATAVVFVQQPTDEVAGVFITPALTARLRDGSGNNVLIAGVAITMSLTSGNGSLTGTLTETTNASGIATFDSLRIDRKGIKTITASSGGLTPAASNSFEILQANASQIRVETAADGSGTLVPAQSIGPLAPMTVFAIARDDFDNFVENIAANTWILQAVTGGVAGGDLVPSGDSRSAVFTGHLVGTGQIRATSPSLTAVNSGTITVIPGAARKLAFIQGPSNGIAGAAISPAVTVQVRDTTNNAVAAQNVSITLALSSGTGTLGGTLPQLTNVSGLASFGDLTVNAAGVKALTASAAGLTSAVSANFTLSTHTITASAGANGSVTPAGAVPVVQGANQSFTIAANAQFHIANVLADGVPQGPVSSHTFTNVTANHTISATFAADTVQVTVQTSPAGRAIRVDGILLTAPQVLNWVSGSSHTIATDSVQNGTAGTRYLYESWSDAGAISHSVSPTSNSTFTANFGTQYFLTMNAGAGGTVGPVSDWKDSAAVVPISATPNTGFSFSGWAGTGSGSFTGVANPTNVTMNGPITQAGSFGTNPISVLVTTVPAGRQIIVDGTTFTSPQIFNWTATQSHTISVDSIQNGTAGTRYLYSSWSDAAARTHTVIPLTDSTFTANFSTQFFLTMNAGTGGSVSPPSDWKNPGENVPISATSSTGYSFGSWTGSGTGSFSGATNPSSVTMNGPITEAAAFTPNPISFTVTTTPVGLSIIVDDTTYTSPHTFNWLAAQTHTISVDSLQNGVTGTRHLYASWSNSGSRTQTIAPLIGGTITASFSTQYFLTMVANAGGTVTPASNWFNAGQSVLITGIPNSGFIFASWSGTGGTGSGFYTGTENPRNIVLGGPVTQTANFANPPVSVTIQTNPPGRTFRVDNGSLQTNTFTFTYNPGDVPHTVLADSIQNGSTGIRYVWTSWSDGGARSHTLVYPGKDTTFVVNFKTQFQLTMNAAAGGTTTPPTGFFDNAQVVPISATPNATFAFGSWTGSGTGSFTGVNNPANVTMLSPITETPAFTLAPINVTVQTNPAGRAFTVDGTPYTGSQSFVWSATQPHTIATTTPQGDTLTRYLFSNWSDGGAISHSVSPPTDTTFTVNFSTQYRLAMLAGTGGTVSPPTGFFNAGQSVPITATPGVGYNFGSWAGTGTGSFTGITNPSSVTMNSPITETGNFTAGTIPITVTTIPAGRTIIVDAATFTSPQTFNWTTGSTHTIATDSIQASGTPGVRYRWLTWSDAGAISHTVTPFAPTTYTALFKSQYQLTMVANPGGTVTPLTGYHDSLASVVITGIPNSGYIFSSWTGTGGPGSGFYTGNTNPQTIPLGGPVTETANFVQPPVNVTIRTEPPGRTFRVDNGSLQTNTFTFSFSPGTTHPVIADSIQNGATGVRYVWTSWSDGGDRSHTLVYPGADTTFVVNFKTQFQLTMNAAAGGTTTPPSGFFDSAQVVGITATPSSGFSFAGWTGTGSGFYTGPNNPSSVTMNGVITETPSFTLAPIDVLVRTNPPGRTFSVDGVTYTNSQSFVWSATALHTLATTSPQGDTSTRYLYSSWSDAGAQSHTVTPLSDTTFTVNFATQYFLTMDTGVGFGTVSPPNGFFNAGQLVSISATADPGYVFAGWNGNGAGSYTGPINPSSVTMNSPVTETATWSAGTIPVTVTTNPSGLSITVDGAPFTSPQTFNWTTGSLHTIATDSLQPSGVTGVRYRWNAWSDAGSLAHTVVPTLATTFTATFRSQYLLTMVANPGGTVTPTTAYHDSLSAVVITGIPNSGYIFSSWTGTGGAGSGFYTGTQNPRSITLGGPVTETANFAQPPVSVTIQTDPPGRTFRVDNGSLITNTFTFTYNPGDVPHTLTADSLQGQTSAARYVWTGWSDGGARTHTIFYPGKDTTIIVSFKRQFFLTMIAGTGGVVLPTNGFFDSAQVVGITATPSGGYSFSGWVGSGPGSYTGPDNPGSASMDSALTQTGTFTLAPVNVTVQSNPAGLQFLVDGTTYTGSQAFVWSATAPHTIAAVTAQGDTATRFVFGTWSDAGSQTHTVAPVGDTTFTVNYSTQYFLAMDTGAGGGTLSPPSGFFNSGQSVQISATPNAGYNFANWTGAGAASYTGPNNPATVTMTSPVRETASWTAGTIPVTVATSPSGLAINVDGLTYTSPQTFNWTTGSSHTITTDSLQASGVGGTRYRWTSWSDAGALAHTVAPTSATTFTATFGLQYLLTMTANPGGTVTPPTGWYDSGTPVNITGLPNTGFSFSTWTGSGNGSYSGSTNPRAITMNGPINEIANFVQNPFQVVIQTVPAGRTFRVSGTNYTTLQTFSISPGNTMSLSIPVNPQSGPAGTQYLWADWSDIGTISHNFTPTGDTVITATFKTQFFLTMNAGTGGTVEPGSGWFDSSAQVPITALPTGGYTFSGWVGSGIGAYSGTNNPSSVTMSSPLLETASFTLFPITVRLRSNPPGRTVLVDTIAYQTPQDLIWTSGTSHTISSDSIQDGGTGVRYLWTGWSDGKPRTHSVTGLSDTTFTVNFRSQYFLTMAAGAGGTVAPPGGWYDSAAGVLITATPGPGYGFDGWFGAGTGSYTGPTNPSSVTMLSPVTQGAAFTLNTINVTVRSAPGGYPIVVDDTIHTSPKVFQWLAGSVHTISTDSVHAPAGSTRLAWASWNDAGARTHTVAPLKDSTFTATLATQYYLTMNTNPGGTVTPSSGWMNSGLSVPITATPNSGYTFASWSGSGTGSYSGLTNPRPIIIGGPITQTANFNQNTVLVTVQTNPPGRTFRVDGTSYTTINTFALLPGTSHLFAVDSIQPGQNGRRYIWTAWSDSGSRSHNFVATGNDSTVIVSFGLQYELSTFATPPLSGTIQPPGQTYYDAGDTATLTASSNLGYAFTSWSGSISDTLNPVLVIMDTAKSIGANFSPAALVHILTDPPGRTIIVDGFTLVAPDTFSWLLNSTHTLGSVQTQDGEITTQYIFTGWSDGGTIGHSVTVNRDTTFTAQFQTRHMLEIISGGNGTVLPAGAWQDQGTKVQITAIPDSGYGFIEWTGEGPAGYSGFSNPVTLTMSGSAKQTASFGLILPPPALAGIPNHALDQPITPRLSWSPYPGATSYIVQVAGDSIFSLPQTIVDSSNIMDTTILLPMLRNVDQYFWRVKARVGLNISSFSETRDFVTIGATIAITSPALNWGTGFTYDVTWSAQNLSGNVHVLLSTNGGQDYNVIDSNRTGTSTRYKVPLGQTPSNLCMIRVVSASDGQFYAEGKTFSILPGALPLIVPVTTTIPFPEEPTISTFYRLVSAPGVVDTMIRLNAQIPGTNPTDWRMFADNGQPENYLIEMGAGSSFETGRGYWLLKKSDLSISTNMAMPPLDTVNAVYRIRLRSGWNIIANPFDKNVSWSSIIALNGLPPNAALYGYEGSYQGAPLLAPFRGYYYFNSANLPELKISYPFGTTIPTITALDVDWQLRLEYSSEVNDDPANYIGVAKSAREGLDDLENHKPPSFLDQGFLYFKRPDWDRDYDLFSTDYRPSVGDGLTWEFEVSREYGTTGALRFEGIDDVPPEYEVYLINDYNSTPVNLRERPDYSFTSVSTTMPFRILVGPKGYVEREIAAEIPQEFGLSQNFPNPFNSTTSISVDLPRDSRILLDVYSVLGQKIATIADGDYAGGVHTFLWEGTDHRGMPVSSGVYLYRLTSGDLVMQAKKMIIAK